MLYQLFILFMVFYLGETFIPEPIGDELYEMIQSGHITYVDSTL